MKRDGFIDSWRGFLHIILTLDHMGFMFPAACTILDGVFEPLGYVSAAEAFVFLSGFVSGIVYTNVRRNLGVRAIWQKALLRSAQIYITYVLAVILLVGLARATNTSSFHWGSWTGLLTISFRIASAKVALLLYQPAFLEILPMYCLFLLITPVIISQFEQKHYIKIGIVSVLIWIVAQLDIRNELIELVALHLKDIIKASDTHFVLLSPNLFIYNIYFGFFNSLGWQLLFVGGLACGHRTYTAKSPWIPTGWILPVLSYLGVIICFILRHNLLGINIENKWVDMSSLGPLRVVNFFCVTYFVCRFRSNIERLVAWKGFAYLSRRSLQVFAFHLFPIYIAALVLKGTGTFSVLSQLFVILYCIASLFLLAFLAQRLIDILNRVVASRFDL